MSPVPFKIGVFILSAREFKLGPRTNSLPFTDHLISIHFIKLFSRYLFHIISTCHVVYNNISINIYSILLKLTYSIQIILLGAILRSNASLLIKLAKVIQIIYSISSILNTIRSLICRWKPYGRNSCFCKLIRIFLK